ncbi:MAG: hypothetical protein MJZ31_12255 [Bacteroidales bacterium]|nr:hypothetical protein [Bacteroidales bacterium]
MRRILIDDRIKKLAAEYVKKLPLVAGEVKADLKNLADDLKKESTEILICTPVEGKKAKGKSSIRKKMRPDAIEAANAEQSLKDKQEKFKSVHHKGSEYLRVSEYVEKIVEKYDNLNNMLPSKFDECISNINSALKDVAVDDIWVKFKGNKDKRPLYEVIVDVMGYDKVRAGLMPNYVKKLEIRSCVYCNAQYAMTTLIEDVHEKIKTGKRGRPKEARIIPLMGGYYELDHNKPKSKYPFLCTNFYNLQPCCGSCNKRKSAQDLPFSFYYEDGDPHPTPLHFALSPQDVIDFHTKGKCRGIKAFLCDEDKPGQPVVTKKDGTLAERFNYIFGIDKIYAEHEDEIEELLWRNRIYTKGIMEATIKQFEKLKIDGFDFDRYILGTYAKKDEVLKRPLTAMKQDVWEQLIKVE